jgi:hypothetical protein
MKMEESGNTRKERRWHLTVGGKSGLPIWIGNALLEAMGAMTAEGEMKRRQSDAE